MQELAWPLGHRWDRWTAAPRPRRGFHEVLVQRRSERMLGRVPLREVLDVVAAATIVQAERVADPLGRTRRPAPSAGALHPVSVVIVRIGYPDILFRVEPRSGALHALRARDTDAMASAVSSLREVVPASHPTFLVLLGDLGLVRAAYANPGSLLWRDAGALLATLHLCASAAGLGFCALGPLGTGFASALFPGRADVVGCGTAAIGVAG